MTDTFARVCDLMGDVLSVSEDEITLVTKQEDLANWDSLQHLNLMLALEDDFDVTLDVSDMQRLTSVRAILEYLES